MGKGLFAITAQRNLRQVSHTDIVPVAYNHPLYRLRMKTAIFNIFRLAPRLRILNLFSRDNAGIDQFCLCTTLYIFVHLSRRGWRTDGPLSLKAVKSGRPRFRNYKARKYPLIQKPNSCLSPLISLPQREESSSSYNDAAFSHSQDRGFPDQCHQSSAHSKAMARNPFQIPGLFPAPPRHRVSTLLRSCSLYHPLPPVERCPQPPPRGLHLRRLPFASPRPSPTQSRPPEGIRQRHWRHL